MLFCRFYTGQVFALVNMKGIGIEMKDPKF